MYMVTKGFVSLAAHGWHSSIIWTKPTLLFLMLSVTNVMCMWCSNCIFIDDCRYNGNDCIIVDFRTILLDKPRRTIQKKVSNSGNLVCPVMSLPAVSGLSYMYSCAVPSFSLTCFYGNGSQHAFDDTGYYSAVMPAWRPALVSVDTHSKL